MSKEVETNLEETFDSFLQDLSRYKSACRVHLKTVLSEKQCDEELLGRLCEIYALVYGNIKLVESVKQEGLTRDHSAALLASVSTLTMLMYEIKESHKISFTFH